MKNIWMHFLSALAFGIENYFTALCPDKVLAKSVISQFARIPPWYHSSFIEPYKKGQYH